MAQYKANRDLLTTHDNGIRPETRTAFILHTDESAYDHRAKRVLDPDIAGWTADRLAEFNRPGGGGLGSYHLGVDKTRRTVRQNDDIYGVWAVGNRGNNLYFHLCLAGTTAFWTRAQWMKRTDQIDEAAKIFVHYHHEYGIPAVRRNGAELRAGKWGYGGHWDCTVAWSGGKGHWDPGGYPGQTAGGFPWDYFHERVLHHLNKNKKTTPAPAPAPQIKETPDMTPEDRKLIQETNERLKLVHDQLAGIGGAGGWPQGGDRTLYDLVAAIAARQGIAGAFDTLAKSEGKDGRADVNA